MHAVLVSVNIDAAGVGDAEQQLRSEVVPRVKQSPGFVAGYWTHQKQDGGSTLQGNSMVVFDSEANAKQAEERIKNGPFPSGVTFASSEVREVVAHA